jgi:hypothetical protein
VDTQVDNIYSILKAAAVFLMMVGTLACNIEDNLIIRLGLEFSYGIVFLIALAVTFLVYDRDILIIAVITFLSLDANMPAEFVFNFGLDRDLFAGLATALIIAPAIHWALR